jgi:predicted nuclease of predicted toxin-antitoxin system
VKLLIDMKLSPRWIEWLKGAGHTAVHWASVGPNNEDDIAIMAYARDHDFVVVTQDLDFSAILAATLDLKPSVVQIRADNVSPDAIGDRVVSALAQLEPELLRGALATIDPGRTRLNILPLRRDA